MIEPCIQHQIVLVPNPKGLQSHPFAKSDDTHALSPQDRYLFDIRSACSVSFTRFSVRQFGWHKSPVSVQVSIVQYKAASVIPKVFVVVFSLETG